MADTLKLIENLRAILASDDMINNIIKSEMKEIADKYGDDRRTTIDMTAVDYIENESLIPNENVVVSMTKNGYIKRLCADTYKTQNRGGVGVKGMTTNEDDFVELLITCHSHDYLLFLVILVRFIELSVMNFQNMVDNLRVFLLLIFYL